MRSRKRCFRYPHASEKGAPHGSNACWHSGCHCARCRPAHSDDQRTRGRAWAQTRLPAEVRQQLLDATYG
jgi:hypothetical protein